MSRLNNGDAHLIGPNRKCLGVRALVNCPPFKELNGKALKSLPLQLVAECAVGLLGRAYGILGMPPEELLVQLRLRGDR